MPLIKRSLTMLAALALLLLAIPASAQESTGVRLLTPYTGISVKAGDAASFNLHVRGTSGATVKLSVEGLPQGWDASFKGGGFVIDSVVISDEFDPSITLEIDIPADTSDGAYSLTVVGTSPAGNDRLTLGLTVAETVGGSVSLTSEFPDLQGPSDAKFNYTLELRNDTADEIQFGLQTQGPAGWQIQARPSGQSQASTVTVQPGGSERVTVDVDPPDFTDAGSYPVLVQAAGGGQTAEAQLTVVITGTYDLALTTPDQRLNVDVESGKPGELKLLVVNNGTAPVTGVTLSSTPPRGWDVTFTPSTIAQIDPGASAEVTATVTPSDQAITGDYLITLRTRVDQASDEIQIRATVKTSTVWGLVGVGVIVVALGALALVFRRFGRR